MNNVLSIIISLLVYPGLIFALVAALLFGWIRGTARAATFGWTGVAPQLSFRELARRLRQSSTVPENAFVPMMQIVPIIAVVCPLLVLTFLPLPGNRGTGGAPYTADIAALGAFIVGMPFARIMLGWSIPSPYTRIAAMRSMRSLIGIALPLTLALAVAVALGNASRVDIIALHSTGFTTSIERFRTIARVLAGIAYLTCLPALARLTAIGEGQGSMELVSSELTELSGRELMTMRVAEWLQLVAAIGLGMALYVLPFFAADNLRGIIAIAGGILIAAGLGIWEGGIAPRIRTREDLGMPYAIWFGAPSLFGIFAVLSLVVAQRYV